MDKLSRLVVLASSPVELCKKLLVHRPSPTIVSTRLAYPFCAWVIKVSLLIKILSLRSIIDPMGSREHLSSLKDHLDTMLVTMIQSSDTRIFIEDEYVHAYIITQETRDGKQKIRKEKNKMLDRIQAQSQDPFLTHHGSCIKEAYQRIGRLIAELKSPTSHSIDVFHKKLGNAGAGETKRGEAAIKASDDAKKRRTKRLKAIGEASAAWQRSEGKNPKGGLNAKGRKLLMKLQTQDLI